MSVAREVPPPVFLGTRRYVCATVTCYLLRKSAARLRPVVASVTLGQVAVSVLVCTGAVPLWVCVVVWSVLPSGS